MNGLGEHVGLCQSRFRAIEIAARHSNARLRGLNPADNGRLCLQVARLAVAPPDFDDIQANYIQRGDAFVVAEISGEIVGTGGLITVDANIARIMRMSVSRNIRRKGIGRALVLYLLDVAL